MRYKIGAMVQDIDSTLSIVITESKSAFGFEDLAKRTRIRITIELVAFPTNGNCRRDKLRPLGMLDFKSTLLRKPRLTRISVETIKTGPLLLLAHDYMNLLHPRQ